MPQIVECQIQSAFFSPTMLCTYCELGYDTMIWGERSRKCCLHSRDTSLNNMSQVNDKELKDYRPMHQ